MTEKKTTGFQTRDSMVLIGIALAIVYWLIESFLYLFASTDGSFIRQLLGVNTYNIYSRVIILCLFAFFGSHVQYTINKRKKAEEALRQSEEKYRNILESIEEGYYEVDTQGNFTFFNDSIRKLFGYSQEELLGMNSREYMTEEDSRRLASTLDRIADTGKPNKGFDCEYIVRDGTKRIIETSISLIADGSGQAIGFRGVARDITEKRNMELKLQESSKNLQAARVATILGLAKLAEYRDMETGSHLERIREFCKAIAIELQKSPKYSDYISDEYIEDIYNSSILHDIGKVGIPDSVLLKPDKLTEEEFEIIKQHTRLGGEALEVIESQTEGQSFLTIGKEIAYYHHEKWDGSGYPKGLKEESIPLSARIVMLADVYDALTSRRIYKAPIDHEEVKDIILKAKGSQFDPQIVDAFENIADEFNRIREWLDDSGTRATVK